MVGHLKKIGTVRIPRNDVNWNADDRRRKGKATKQWMVGMI